MPTETSIVPVPLAIDTELVLLPELPLADRHPAAVYLSFLRPTGRRSMRQALDVVAKSVSPTATVETLPWHLLRFQHTAAISKKLSETYAPASVRKMCSALRRVLRTAFDLGLMSGDDYERAIDMPKVRGKRLPAGRALERKEIDALLACCDTDTAIGARDRALLAVLYGAGLRRAEAAALTLDRVNLASGEIRIIGKGDKERATYMPAGAVLAVQKWLEFRGQAPGPLFYAMTARRQPTGHGFTDQAVLVILARLAKKAGISVPFSPHDMRRTFATDLLDAGNKLTSVKELLGHESADTTLKYNREAEDAKKKAVASLYFPV